ncbi:MAG: DUF4288 domain-containing protein [Clostridia bacterium]|nr:DUF4288 domain-containing protein [Clostridia bacterium]
MKYSVKLLIKSTAESGEVSIEESILMMDADSFDDAYDKAERYVETGVCEPYVNIFGKRVDVEVVSYADCFRIDEDEADEVTEVYSSIVCPNAKQTEEMIVAVHEASATAKERTPFRSMEFANLSVEELEELLRKAKE